MAERARVRYPRRGDVYLVNFEPTIGAEIKKTRPSLILQNDIANRHSPVTIVAAISSQFTDPLYPTEVLIHPPEGGLTADAEILLNQLRTIDKKRLIRRMGKLNPESIDKDEQALLISFGLIAL